jgi:nucleoside-diphosphate-sugar epimerase
MKKVIITGSNGYIGSQLVSRLVNKYTIISVDKEMYHNEFHRVDKGWWVHYPVSVAEFIKKHAQEHKDAFAIIHLSGLSNDPLADFNLAANMEYNYHDTVRMVDWAVEHNTERFLYASSASVYGMAEDGPLTENGYLNPASNYSKSKHDSEHYLLAMHEVHEDSFRPIIFRKATVMGVSERMRFDLVVNTMVKDAYRYNTINLYGGGENWRPLININDVVSAYEHALDMVNEEYLIRSNAPIYNLLHKNYRISELGLYVAHIMNKDWNRRIYVNADYDKPKDVRNYRLCGNKYEMGMKRKNEIGVRETVSNIMHWIQQNNPDFDDPKYYNIKYILETEKWAKKLGVKYIL